MYRMHQGGEFDQGGCRSVAKVDLDCISFFCCPLHSFYFFYCTHAINESILLSLFLYILCWIAGENLNWPSLHVISH